MASLVQQSAVPSSSSKAPASSFKGKAVVIGAGPAGFAASMYLARRGFKVDVFDKRPAPCVDKTSGNWVLGLNSRSLLCLNDLCPQLPCIDPQVAWTMGAFFDSKLRVAPTAPGAGKDVYSSMYVVDRQRLTRQMYEAASQQYPDSITWHFEHELAGLDIKARRVQAAPTTSAAAAKEGAAAPEAAQKLELGYDLLVGADGVNSAVRRQLEGQEPGARGQGQQLPGSFWSREVYQSHILRKVFRGLPLQVEGVEDFAPGFHTHKPWQYVYFLNFGASSNNAMAFWISFDGSVDGVINGVQGRFQDAGALKQDLASSCPSIPVAWVDQICEQVAGPSSVKPFLSRIVQCSRLNGPRLVLLGDAAHSITPDGGQGCNMALETTRVFGTMLEECGDDLDSLPQRFSDARMPDVRGQQAYDYMVQIIKAPSRAGFPLLDTLCAMWVLRPVQRLAAMLPARFPALFPKGPPLFDAMRDARVGFGKIWSNIKLLALAMYTTLASLTIGLALALMKCSGAL